ncbi:UDP-N-acetylglucosamine 1-carboxyvinyltransferase [Flexistipes sp.]|uniref:UDP-N-acetylglucosamine 1-carboxyvinyltransferase n=1 Tax=Flexistipes sp. TaxID=3088135 RepID=UPI002E21765A|nr:UDP-N-acetylglucosamine 1-carboxyvinyltransferase [Flexistipes sp.]
MEKLIVKGGNKINGSVKVSGAKNAALPILCATILAEGEYYLSNIPKLRDISTMLGMLDVLGITSRQVQNDVTVLNVENRDFYTAPYELVKLMRAGVLMLGPLLAKRKKARISLPGGCAIGERPVDLHIKALTQMGADVEIKHGYIEAECDGLKGADINFDIVTVTGTENIIMAATLAEGVTVIKNAAREPEVIDLINFLNKMGADIKGAGSSTITVRGVKVLKPCSYSVMTDRIEAGTFLCALAAVGGELTLKNAPVKHMGVMLDKLKEIGLNIDIKEDCIRASANERPSSADVSTQPYPGFPTDMQAQFMACMTVASGISVITENIFENRFMHVAEMKRMGADITLKNRSAVVKGVDKLTGAHVMASDLRASAGLFIAAMLAEGESHIHRVYHLDRGYDGFDRKMAELGISVKRVADE